MEEFERSKFVRVLVSFIQVASAIAIVLGILTVLIFSHTLKMPILIEDVGQNQFLYGVVFGAFSILLIALIVVYNQKIKLEEEVKKLKEKPEGKAKKGIGSWFGRN